MELLPPMLSTTTKKKGAAMIHNKYEACLQLIRDANHNKSTKQNMVATRQACKVIGLNQFETDTILKHLDHPIHTANKG